MTELLSRRDLQYHWNGFLSVKPIVWVSGLMLLALLGLYIGIGDKLFAPIYPQDEGILLVYPDLILSGLMPGRDFSVLYPPGNFYFLAGAYHLFGIDIIVERLVGFLYMYLIIVGAFFLGFQLGWFTGVFAAATSLIVLSFFPSLGAYSINAAIALALFSLLSSHMSVISDNSCLRARWGFFAGLLVGVVLLFRHDVAVVTGLACSLMIGTFHIRYLKSFFFGVLVATSPFVLFSLDVGLDTVWDNLFIDIRRVGPGRRLPLYPSLALLTLLLSIFTSLIVASIFIKRWKHSPYFHLTLGIGVLSLGLLPSALQRADTWHIVYVGSATGALAVISVSALILQISKELSAPLYLRKYTLLTSDITGAPPEIRSSTVTVLLMLTMLCITTLFILEAKETWWNLSALKNRQVIVNDRWVPINQSNVQSLQSLINTLLNVAKPGDRLFVGPNDLRRTNYNDTFIYFLTPNLRPASYYLEMNPGSANRMGSRLARDIASADLVVLTTEYDTWNEPNESVSAGDTTPNKIMANEFCLHSIHGEYSIYLKCIKQHMR